jgi:hypothetical protein
VNDSVTVVVPTLGRWGGPMAAAVSGERLVGTVDALCEGLVR